MSRWPVWLVRAVIFGGLGMLLLLAVGGRIRADRALDRASEVARMGTPGEVAARAQQMVSVWAGQPAVVIAVEPEQRHWRATAMVGGGTCYELVVADKVSAHPGLVPCPSVSAAGSADDALSGSDQRREVVVGFLDAWLRGDSTADRYLADERPSIAGPPEKASDVKVVGVFGDAGTQPRSIVTARADVTYPDRTETLAWTLALTRGDNRWSVDQVAGGEIPTGDAAPLARGRTSDTARP